MQTKLLTTMNCSLRLAQFVALAVLASVGFIARSANATAFRTSQLVGLSSGTLGTVGTAEFWTGSSGNFTVTSGAGSLDGTPLGLYPSAGDRVDIAASTTFNSLNTYNNFASSGQYPQSGNINLYYSFLYRFNTLTNMSSAASGVSNKIVQVNRIGSSSGVHFEVHSVTNASGYINLGVNKTGGTPAYAGTNLSPGQTFFVVLRQQIIAGSANDQIDMWINPPANKFGVDEANIPTPDVSTTSGTEDSSSTGPGRFYILAGVSASFDELRISTNSWADVTPSVSSCVPAAFDSNPVDVTVNDGIAASFTVTSSSSSPLYQWQFSPNGGSTWQNVTNGIGGTAASYATPPLSAVQNGYRYRCIASVSCGSGSTATSGVAVVTANAPVVTAAGVVVDDRFLDLSRANTPVGISNAVWYASTANSMSDGSTGEIVGTPGTGSSRLWLNYFTDNTTTNLPVHLAVGKKLKATLAFKASNIVVTNGGASMRLGLFDYADGGTRVTADGFGTGSAGNGNGVRGYMFTLDWGTQFSASSPLSLFVRNVLNDNNLMGTTGDYATLSGTGSTGLAGSAAFQNNTSYTMTMTVERTSASSVTVAVAVTSASGTITWSAVDSVYAYPRFDAFAIRPNSLETVADSFTITRFTVEVVDGTPTQIPLNITSSGGNVTLTWTNPAFTLQAAPSVTGTYTNVTSATSPYTISAGEARKFFRLTYP